MEREEGERKKIFYSIREVSEITGLSPSTLRFWEKKFSSLSPERTQGGRRRYREEDIELILRIKRLLQEEGLTIKGAVERLKGEKDPLSLYRIKETLKEILEILK